MPSEPPPTHQPWSRDEELEAPDYLGAAPPLSDLEPTDSLADPQTPRDERRARYSWLTARLRQPTFNAPDGVSRRGPVIGWTIVVLIVVIVVILVRTGVIKPAP
jgi:hypothetical protein